MKTKGIALLLILMGVVCANKAYAGWPIGKYHYILSPAYAIYAAENGWNAKGKYFYGDGTSFLSQSVGLSGIYGLGRKLDFSASLPYIFQSFKSGAYKITASGPGDLQAGFTYNLFNFKYANFISLYAGVVVPLYTNTRSRIFGLGNNGSTILLSNSGSIGPKVFYNVQVGGSFYTGEDAPKQLNYNASVGFSADKWNIIGFDFGGINSYSANKTYSANSASGHDYQYTKATVSVAHSFSKRVTISTNGYLTVTGRNIGQGYGGALSFILHLP